ncbi:MAG TPA: LCP family protein [Thermomicrobiales bacterium]|nr:LCP family protein [Thermomicrobiales bacterium]
MTSPEHFGRPVNRRGFVGAGAAAGTAAAIALGGMRLALTDVAAQENAPGHTFVVAGLDGWPGENPTNTDVLMIARLDLAAMTVRALSIPRDLYVEIPDVGYDRINRAFDHGATESDAAWHSGIEVTRQTILTNFGVRIDGAVTTTFDGFVGLVNALDGVDLDNPYDLADDQYPDLDSGVKSIFYPAGETHLSGEQALEFARTRHQDGDDGRVMRQQLVLLAMLEKVQTAADRGELADLTAQRASAVSDDLGDDLAALLMEAVSSLDPANVTFGTIAPFLWSETLADSGLSVYQGDWGSLPCYVQAFLAGEAA